MKNEGEKAFEALSPGGKIILHEMIFEEGKTAPFLTAGYNIKMVMWTEGQQFTFNELDAMLKAVGFEGVRMVRTVGSWSVVVGQKPLT